MKLGLLTFQDTNNFGSLLQTFALYKILSEHSDGCEVLNYRCLELYKREIPKPFYKLRTVRDLYRYIKYYKMQVHKYKNLCQFSEKYMKSTPVLENNKIKDYAKKYNRNLLGGLYRENPVKSRNYEAVKSSKKWENVGNSYIIPALLLYRYSYI